MTVPITSQIYNPITGVFGSGNMQIFGGDGINTATYTFTVPAGVSAVRARCFGGGGGSSTAAGGGAFTLKAIYGLVSGTTIAITVGKGGNGTAGGTSSFGSYCSAGGGPITASSAYATATGGDINYNGGNTSSGGIGAGVASIFGNGGSQNCPGPSGAGVSNNGWNMPGLFGQGSWIQTTASSATPPTSGIMSIFSIDFIGTGGGGYNGINGGGGYANGGYPGGGGSNASGAAGMVIVEW